jgi:hypothetical protein
MSANDPKRTFARITTQRISARFSFSLGSRDFGNKSPAKHLRPARRRTSFPLQYCTAQLRIVPKNLANSGSTSFCSSGRSRHLASSSSSWSRKALRALRTLPLEREALRPGLARSRQERGLPLPARKAVKRWLRRIGFADGLAVIGGEGRSCDDFRPDGRVGDLRLAA